MPSQVALIALLAFLAFSALLEIYLRAKTKIRRVKSTAISKLSRFFCDHIVLARLFFAMQLLSDISFFICTGRIQIWKNIIINQKVVKSKIAAFFFTSPIQ